MKFRRRSRSNLTDIQAARLATAANGAYDPMFEVDSDIPAMRSLGAFAAIFRGVALGLATVVAVWRAASAADPAQYGNEGVSDK
jgi:hypothetical protein